MFLNGVKDAVILNNVTFQNSSSMGRGGAISAQSDGEQKPINLQISILRFKTQRPTIMVVPLQLVQHYHTEVIVP